MAPPSAPNLSDKRLLALVAVAGVRAPKGALWNHLLPDDLTAYLAYLTDRAKVGLTPEENVWLQNWSEVQKAAIRPRLDFQNLEQERSRRETKRIVDAEERGGSKEPLRALTLEELFARPRPDYLIDEWFPEGALAELVGPTETLKSFFMCHAGLAIASRQQTFFGYSIVKHGPVLYIAAEGSGAFQYRVRAWCRKHDVDPKTVPFHVIPMPVDLRDLGIQSELGGIVRDLHPVMIVVDTLSRCTPGADENSSRDMGEVTYFCVELQKASGATVVFIHHPPKADERGAGRGSGAILGAIDTELRSSNRGEPNPDGSRPIQITCTKQKDDMKPPALDLVGERVPVLDDLGRELCHESGRPITTLVLRIAKSNDTVITKRNGKDGDPRERILALVRASPGMEREAVVSGAAKRKSDTRQTLDVLVAAGLLRPEEVKEGRAKKTRYWPVEQNDEM